MLTATVALVVHHAFEEHPTSCAMILIPETMTSIPEMLEHCFVVTNTVSEPWYGAAAAARNHVRPMTSLRSTSMGDVVILFQYDGEHCHVGYHRCEFAGWTLYYEYETEHAAQAHPTETPSNNALS